LRLVHADFVELSGYIQMMFNRAEWLRKRPAAGKRKSGAEAYGPALIQETARFVPNRFLNQR
jgi:hypothetical protein